MVIAASITALHHVCPHCGADRGQMCRTKRGGPLKSDIPVHSARLGVIAK